MRAKRTEGLAVTLTCFCVSGIALAFGVWIAGGPTDTAAWLQASGPVLALACTSSDPCDGVAAIMLAEAW